MKLVIQFRRGFIGIQEILAVKEYTPDTMPNAMELIMLENALRSLTGLDVHIYLVMENEVPRG